MSLASRWPLCVCVLLVACESAVPPDEQAARFSANRVAADVQRLASDEFQGRAPGTEGEKRVLDFLVGQFEDAGLQPANQGSFLQAVPLVSLTANPDRTLAIEGPGFSARYAVGSQTMLSTKRVQREISLDNSEMVFVGYGIVAPEYAWDDYAAVDVRGKTVVILVNDPGFATADPELFRGNTMTYYGRWTYKYEEAARQGAAAALIIHETDAAGYGWDVVANSWSGEQFDLVRANGNRSAIAVEGWLSGAAAAEILAAAGLDLESARQMALAGDFEAVALGLTASTRFSNEIKNLDSSNVAGLIEGSKRPEEIIIYMAHWDHLGIKPNLEGDRIFNGAVDNATGTAAIIELARAFAALEPAPERSILFLAVTGEESGLLGSAWYAEHPLFPLNQTVAALNFDSLIIDGATRDITVFGLGSSELEEYLERAATKQGRVPVNEPTPEKGYFFRSDHFNLAKVGVPVLYAKAGVDNLQHGREWGVARMQDYRRDRYHQPTDEYDADWDWGGVLQDLELYFEIGRELAAESTFPNWYENSEFRARRDESRSSAD
ncbi:MAG: M20/M25/M40 family metallo-hydrolase [Proteobacteria bacterium]|nr:M20/M25/M40 family metallo-hydrolase [Pseudomonadota bacterium]